MTLHIAYIGDDFVLQVGDRLLTTEGSTGLEPWDVYANKSIYVEALDGRIAISYAGLAYVGADPTDEWLVRVITGVEPRAAFHPGGGPPTAHIDPLNLTLDGIHRSIVEAIEQDFVLDVNSDVGIEVLMAGWTFTDDASQSPSTFAVSLSHDGVPGTHCDEEFARSRTLKPIGPTFGACVLLIGSGTQQQTRDVAEKIRNLDRWPLPKDVEDAIVDEIRRASTPGSGIGSELMSICIPGNGGDGYLKYLRDTSLPTPIGACSPAVIFTGGMIAYPTVMTGSGGGSYVSGGPGWVRRMHVECVPPMPDAPGRSEWSSQPRKPLA